MNEKLIHEIIPVGMLQCNCSILGDPVTREAIVVDPGDDLEHVLQILTAQQIESAGDCQHAHAYRSRGRFGRAAPSHRRSGADS